jgi:glycosyltransferase involved in cell wall biosynthesis
MARGRDRLRVALLAGTLGQGGAEKQLVYMVQTLQRAGVEVQVYCLTRGEFYEPVLRDLGIEPIWIGRFSNPLLRLAAMARAMREYKPQILQSAHFYTNFYVAVVARLLGIAGIGSIRGDAYLEVSDRGRWGRWLMHMSPSLLVNSQTAKRNAEELGIKADSVSILPNVIDLSEFEASLPGEGPALAEPGQLLVVTVGSLIDCKRQDRFLMALARARQDVPTVTGVIIGDGPERGRLEALASSLGLLPRGVLFLGRRNDVPALLRSSDLFVLSSESEGFPNVLLEAMAARLPVVTTAAGDSATVVQDGLTGYVVPIEDVEGMAERIVRVAQSPDLRRRLGEAGRRRVELQYSSERLGDHLLSAYDDIARQQNDHRLLQALHPGSL